MDDKHLPAHYSSNEELRAVSERHVIKSMGDEPLALARASGVHVPGADGREYLDAISGEWVVNLG
ncbi:uncharacterized protein METZ01_LOCUS304165, partial [marine metagenome]